MWLNLPLAPMLTNRRGAIDRPVMPIWRERGSQPLSVTLRVAPSSRAEQRAQRFEVVVRVGRDALADTDDGVRLGEQVEVVVAGAGEHADAAARRRACGRRDATRRSRRGGARIGSTPARTVAIWIADEQWIAATS